MGRSTQSAVARNKKQITMNTAKQLTQMEFDEADFALAERMARRLGYTQTAYTSSSDLIGLFCLRDRPRQNAACIIKTREFGLMAVMTAEDLNLEVRCRQVESEHEEKQWVRAESLSFAASDAASSESESERGEKR